MRTFTFILLLSSCSLVGSFESSILNKQTVEVYKRNGEKAWCMQKEYRSCTKTTLKQCISEQSVNKERCVEHAVWRVPKVSDAKSVGDYSEAFMVCMANEHVYEFYNKDIEMANCIFNSNIDSKLLQKHVYELKVD